MTGSTLIAHSPRFESKLVSVAELAKLPEPSPLGVRHKPVPHIALVERIFEEIDRRGLQVTRSQFALGAKGHALFGVIDLRRGSEAAGERGLSFGFRSSTNQALSIKAVAGTRVFVCDNLALSGDMIALMRKSTTGLDLKDAIAGGFDKFAQHTEALDVQIDVLKLTDLSDGEAKQRIFDVFHKGIVPVKLFEDVSRYYFNPQPEQTDVTPRSLWGLHNAFTRAMKELSPVRAFGATVELGKFFGMGKVIDGEVVEG